MRPAKAFFRSKEVVHIPPLHYFTGGVNYAQSSIYFSGHVMKYLRVIHDFFSNAEIKLLLHAGGCRRRSTL